MSKKRKKSDKNIVLILDGKSEIGPHVGSNLCYLICIRHLIRSKAVINLIFFFSKKAFLHSKLPSNVSIMDKNDSTPPSSLSLLCPPRLSPGRMELLVIDAPQKCFFNNYFLLQSYQGQTVQRSKVIIR